MARADIHKVEDKETNELAANGYSFLFNKDIDVLEVVLSERNLLSLLSKLYIEGSRKTIYNGDVPKGFILKLVVEDDESHYADRPRPGVMHHDTEDLVQVLKTAIKDWEDKHKVVELFHKSIEDAQGA